MKTHTSPGLEKHFWDMGRDASRFDINVASSKGCAGGHESHLGRAQSLSPGSFHFNGSNWNEKKYGASGYQLDS